MVSLREFRGAGLLKAIAELWPRADRQRCTVHRVRNVRVKLPRQRELREGVRRAHPSALDEASDPEDAERRLRVLVGELQREYPSAAACLADDLAALCVHMRYPLRLRRRPRQSPCGSARLRRCNGG